YLSTPSSYSPAVCFCLFIWTPLSFSIQADTLVTCPFASHLCAPLLTGALHLNECPAAPLIPVYVMVCGIIALLLMGLVVLPKLLCPAAQGLIWTCCVLTLILLTFIWFLVGNYKLTQEPAADQAEATKAYCDKTLYLLAFWATTMIYVFAGNALLIMACLYGCMGIMNMITNHLF
uniref:Uncharacterized protein n=1 Tax=Cynoglossus semilaevis TaxID=244447 RepID=A0A3P8UY76_CYNSE